jgi:hypothetical protein
MKLVPLPTNPHLRALAVEINTEMVALDSLQIPSDQQVERLILLFGVRDHLIAIIQFLND